MTREEAIRILASSCIPGSKQTEALETLIPELREFEDERIRKELIEYHKQQFENNRDQEVGLFHKDAIAWLEKQKEYRSDDVLSSTYQDGFEDGFKVGREVERRNSSDNDFIKPRMQEPWNKEKQKEQKPVEWNANDKAFIKDCARILDENGYAASAERLLSMFPVKPAEWSEEDEKMMKFTLQFLDYHKLADPTAQSCKDWLKSLPERFNLQPQQEWSEEDIKKIRSEEYTKGFNDAAFGGKLKEWSVEDEDRIRQIERIAQQAGCTQKLQEEIHDWFKSLRPQPKQEWKYYIWGYNMKFNEDALVIYEDNGECEFVRRGNKPRRNVNGTYVLIKDIYPQPHWKPSEDEVRLINTSISFLKDFADKGYENAVECIDWLKSKLNGNSGK